MFKDHGPQPSETELYASLSDEEVKSIAETWTQDVRLEYSKVLARETELAAHMTSLSSWVNKAISAVYGRDFSEIKNFNVTEFNQKLKQKGHQRLLDNDDVIALFRIVFSEQMRIRFVHTGQMDQESKVLLREIIVEVNERTLKENRLWESLNKLPQYRGKSPGYILMDIFPELLIRPISFERIPREFSVQRGDFFVQAIRWVIFTTASDLKPNILRSNFLPKQVRVIRNSLLSQHVFTSVLQLFNTLIDSQRDIDDPAVLTDLIKTIITAFPELEIQPWEFEGVGISWNLSDEGLKEEAVLWTAQRIFGDENRYRELTEEDFKRVGLNSLIESYALAELLEMVVIEDSKSSESIREEETPLEQVDQLKKKKRKSKSQKRGAAAEWMNQSVTSPDTSETDIPETDSTLDQPIVKAVLEELLNNDEKRALFEYHYPNFTDLPTQEGEEEEYTKIKDKYRLARDLLLSKLYPNPRFLIDNFLVSGGRQFDQILHRHLILLFSRLYPEFVSADEEVRVVIEDILHKHPELLQFIEIGVPIEVMGEVLAYSGELSDLEKVNAYRSMLTKGLVSTYLGQITGKKIKRKPLNPIDLLNVLPNRVFENPEAIKNSLVAYYFQMSLMKLVTEEGIENGFRQIEQLIEECSELEKRKYLELIYERFLEIETNKDHPAFRKKILVRGQEKDFPSFEQRVFCHNFLELGTAFVSAETGLGKTGAAFYAIEHTDAKHVLIIAPPSAKITWMTEVKKLFIDSQSLLYVIKNGSDLLRAIDMKNTKYFVISQDLLSNGINDRRLAQRLEVFTREIRIDGAIIDEIDNLKNPRSAVSQVVASLLKHIRHNYLKGQHTEEHRQLLAAPVIGLSATPLRTKIADLDVPMGLLYPEKFVTFTDEISENGRTTFSYQHLNRPDLVHARLFGEGLMFRWEQARGVQPFSYQVQQIDVSPFERALYDYIYDNVALDAMSKIRLLSDCVFNPTLVRVDVRNHLGNDYDEITDEDLSSLAPNLLHILDEWKKLRNIQYPEDVDDYLSVDTLVQLGYAEDVIRFYLSSLLENGLDTFVDEFTRDSNDPDMQELRKFWLPREFSSKYQHIRKVVFDALTWKEDATGQKTRKKVMIVCPSRRQGRTGPVEQKIIISADGRQRALYETSELEYLNEEILVKTVRKWVAECTGGDGTDCLVIDGEIKVGRGRKEIIDRWTNDPKAAVLLVTLESVYQSGDYTLNEIEDEQGRIEGIVKLLVAPPYHWQQLKQMGGRTQRQGQKVPVELLIQAATGLIDEGKMDAVKLTYLFSRMILAGIVLTPEEQEFFDSKLAHRHLDAYNPDKYFLSSTFSYLRSAGEEVAYEYFGEKERGRKMAERFFDGGRDIYRLTGQNARLVASIVSQAVLVNEQENILSVGAGTLLLQRILKRGIDNLDLNPQMMDVGWQEAGQYGGRKIVGKASRLFKLEGLTVGSYGIVDYAYALDWSKLKPLNAQNLETSERVMILKNISQALRIGGLFILTLPKRTLTDESFSQFCESLETHFGFEVIPDYSGKSYGVSHIANSKRIGWCIVAKKTREVDISGLNIFSLKFSEDEEYWVTATHRRKRAKSGSGSEMENPDPKLAILYDEFRIETDRATMTTVSAIQEAHKNQERMIKKPSEILQEERDSNYVGYKGLVRFVQKKLELSWAAAEERLIEEVQNIDDKTPREFLKNPTFEVLVKLVGKELSSDRIHRN